MNEANLKRLGQLKVLFASKSRLSDAGTAEWKAALPNLTVP